MGCQEEHFGQWKHALRAYEKAANLTEKHFKSGDQLTQRFRKDYENFKKRMMEHGFNASREGSVISEKSRRASSRNNSMHKATSSLKKNVRPNSATSNRSNNQSRAVPEWKFKDSPYDHAPKKDMDRHRACIPNRLFGQRTLEKSKTPAGMVQQKNDWNVTRKIQPSPKQNNPSNKPKFMDYKMNKNHENPTQGGLYINDTGHHGGNSVGKVNFQARNNFMGGDSDSDIDMDPHPRAVGNRGGPVQKGNGMGVIGTNNKSAKDLNYIEKLKNNEMLTFVSDEGEDDEYFNNTVNTKKNNAGNYKRKMENTLQHLKNFQGKR